MEPRQPFTTPEIRQRVTAMAAQLENLRADMADIARESGDPGHDLAAINLAKMLDAAQDVTVHLGSRNGR
jgi:hypothetical protein